MVSLDTQIRVPVGAIPDIPPARPPRPRRRWQLDGFDGVVLGVFVLISAWTLGIDVWQVIANGRTWTGTDGIYVVDQQQYLAWIQSASHHVAAANLFVLRPTAADYVQPAVVISGLLAALGVPPWIALLLWQPVAVLACFAGVRAYVRHTVADLPGRRVALVLAIFFGALSVVYGSFGNVGDLMFTFLSWGYTFGLLAVALMLLALLAYDRARVSGRRVWLPAALGGAAALLHPWQGEMLVLLIVGAEAVIWWRTRRRPRLLPPAIVTGVTLAALLYYEILGRLDPSWQLARDASKHSFSFWSVVLALVPLLIFALPAYARRGLSFLDLVTRAWPLAAVAIYLFSATALSATPLHAFDGITVPLAVLSVEGVRRTPLRRVRHQRLLAGLAVALAVVPGTVHLMQYALDTLAPTPGNANFIAADEQRALNYLKHSRVPGGVLSRFYLGEVIPAQTGRKTFVGDCLWSEPACNGRAFVAQDLFEGAIGTRAARAFVRASGARFVLADCQVGHASITSIVAPMTDSIRRFGCATVFELRYPLRRG
jgi:hypothetical protein